METSLKTNEERAEKGPGWKRNAQRHKENSIRRRRCTCCPQIIWRVKEKKMSKYNFVNEIEWLYVFIWCKLKFNVTWQISGFLLELFLGSSRFTDQYDFFISNSIFFKTGNKILSSYIMFLK